ncbi:hypothetical protein SAMD00019534_023870, partial [Acytostelium subglobosum LB1]|uniref:hypothetical protein n=1 Tax=Acytostelium subglobosum LB1 TaxID=1410327 RepID=UPI000644AD9A
MSSLKNIVPLLDRILIEKISKQTQTAGGILLPQMKSNSNQARVIAVGTGAHRPDGTFAGTIVQKGDTVIVAPTARAYEVPVDNKTYYIVSELDILGIAKVNE